MTNVITSYSIHYTKLYDKNGTVSGGESGGGSDEADELLPKAPDWAGGLRETWRPGEDGAFERLQAACA